MGETRKSAEFFKHFIRAQNEFRPDKVDTFFELYLELDTSKLLLAAKQEIGKLVTTVPGER
jgi:hypothetical protein